MVGQTVSHYRIVERLGGGGMGVVYKALDTRLNRFVALKFISPDLTKDRDANDRFVQEAQAASGLDHPNICTIHEIDEMPDGTLFLTMAYYDGETLKQRIERGPWPIEEAVDVAIQLAQALAKAHESAIVHRDIKPANIMIAKNGLTKILDFGLAKLAGRSDLTRTGTTLGTVAYMSPEQIRGGDVGAGTDVWSLGVVLYEMLTGRRPFEGKDDLAVVSSILNSQPEPVGKRRADVPPALQKIVARALDKNAASRYRSATELLTDLVACRATLSKTGPQNAELLRLARRPIVAVPAAVLLVAAVVMAVIVFRRSARVRWAHEVGIPQITRLVEADKLIEAFALAKEVERAIPNDPALASLWPQFSVLGSIVTAPDAADVYMQPYAAADAEWEHLGRTPIKDLRLARGAFRFRIEKEGFEPLLLASTNPGILFQNLARAAPLQISLLKTGAAPDMVPVPGGPFPVGLSGFNSDVAVSLDPFTIDRTEVTNRAFKRFVDSAGYTTPEYWTGMPLVKAGRELTTQEPAALFHDSTDRPGPATWELGEYPAGQADYPVGGVSWYEAVAYCRSEGKTLPTLFHWARAALSPVEISSPLAPSIIPASNFSGKSPVQVGSFRGIGPYGTVDMAGNVREWVWNESGAGRRWIAGGAWSDPGYMFVVPNSLPPLDRSAINGFRCARMVSDAPVPDRLLARVETNSRDNRAAKAVSDEVFQVFKRQLAYVKSPLNARVDAKDTSSPDWIRETLSFDAGYENGRVLAYLFLPRNARPPYQLAVYFPGAPFGRASSQQLQPGQLDFVVKSGRALIWPVYKGYFERWDPFLTRQGEDYLRAFRTRMFQWRQDLGRTLEVLSERQDIDTTRVAYVGLSFGATTAFPLIALEDRVKVAVLLAAGFTYRELPPEADAMNYVSHVTMPVLMVGGRHDYVFPLETSQNPMFERLGTPTDQKRHVIFDCGHFDFPRSELIREVLPWLDRYLGPVSITAPSAPE